MRNTVEVHPDGVIVGSGAAMARYEDSLRQQAYEKTVRIGKPEAPVKAFADVRLGFACQGCGTQEVLLESGGNTGTRLWCSTCYSKLQEIEREQLAEQAARLAGPDVE